MSDGHNDRSWNRKTPDIKDAAGHDVYINDAVWFAAEDGQLLKANVLEVFPQGYITLMTKSNSIIEITFKPKNSIPTCNCILKD